MTERFPRDRFDDVTDGPRVGAHRGARRRGRGWIAFAWGALATGVLVLVGVLVLALLNGSYSFPTSTISPSASSSASAPASATPTTPAPTEEPSSAAAPTDQGSTSVVVLNGTSTTGLAAGASGVLTTAGWQVASTGDAGTTGTTTSTVYYQQPDQAAVAQGVADALGITAVQQSAAFPNADVSVVLGADYGG